MVVFAIVPIRDYGENELKPPDYNVRVQRAEALAQKIEGKLFNTRDSGYHEAYARIVGVVIKRDDLEDVARLIREHPNEYRLQKVFYTSEDEQLGESDPDKKKHAEESFIKNSKIEPMSAQGHDEKVKAKRDFGEKGDEEKKKEKPKMVVRNEAARAKHEKIKSDMAEGIFNLGKSHLSTAWHMLLFPFSLTKRSLLWYTNREDPHSKRKLGVKDIFGSFGHLLIGPGETVDAIGSITKGLGQMIKNAGQAMLDRPKMKAVPA